MSASNSQVPQVANRRYVSPMQAKADKMAADWMSPLNIVMVALVAALVLGLVMYYTVALMFDAEAEGQGAGILVNAGWSASGGGILIILLTILSIGSAAACLGMGWKNNSQALLFTALAAGLLGFMYYFAFAATRDDKKNQIALWALLGLAGTIGIAVYSWWGLRNWAKDVEANPGSYAEMVGDKSEAEHIKERAKWSSITLGATVVFGVITAAGLWQIHNHVHTESA